MLADQLAVRRLLLEHEGYEVTEARDVRSARLAFATLAPEVVLMDLTLERDGDAVELIREFRQRQAFGQALRHDRDVTRPPHRDRGL